MKQSNLALDLYSMMIGMVLILYIVMNRKYGGRFPRSFLAMCIFNMLMTLGDVINWAFGGYGRGLFPFVLKAGSFVCFLSSALLLLAFVGYITDYLSARVKVHKGFFSTALVLTVLHICLLVSDQFFNRFYYFTKDNYYVRGEWFFLIRLNPLILYGISVSLILLYRRYQKPKEFFCLLSYLFLPAAAGAIQAANYGIALLNPVILINLLWIFVNIQLEQNLLVKQQEKKLSELHMSLMLSQIKHHFLYNSLTAIRHLCETEPKKARQAVSDLSMFIRGNMDSLECKEPIPFEKELNHVEHYLALEEQRLGNRICVVYEIEARNFSIPPLTLQPIVENAFRHGILKRDEGGTVRICTKEMKESYVVTVADDGVGFGKSVREAAKGRSHVGIQNVRERLKLMCSGTLEVSGEAGKGTVVTITIPKGSEDGNDIFGGGR